MKDLTKPGIRDATLNDVCAIRKFHARSWLDTYPNEDAGVPLAWVEEKWQAWDSPEKMQESRERIRGFLADKDQLYDIAIVEDRVVGLLHVSRHTDNQELGALYVDRKYRGSGLAQELMKLADEFWRKDEAVTLAVVDYNGRAKRFYEKQGFRKVEGSEYLHADKMPSIKMIRGVKS